MNGSQGPEVDGSSSRRWAAGNNNGSATKLLVRSIMLMMFGLFLNLILDSQFVSCGSQQPEQQKQNPYSFGSEYSLISDNLVNLGQPMGFNQGKRARKMSAFMPMRGRKDGRDGGSGSGERAQLLYTPLTDYESAASGQQPSADFWPRDQDEPSIMRLAASATGNAPFGMVDSTHQWTPMRQFSDQLALQHLLAEAALRAQRASDRSLAAAEGIGSDAGDQDGGGSLMMQAKLRRAFHPMRGKKSLGGQSFAEDMIDS